MQGNSGQLPSRQALEVEALIQIGKALTFTLEYREVLALLMAEAGRLLGAKCWSLLLLDEESGELVFEIAVSPFGEQLKGMRLAKGEGIAGWVALHGEPLLVADVRQDQRFAPQVDRTAGFVTRSIACVPVKCREKTYGIMQLINAFDDTAFAEEDLRILITIADFTAIAIENARQFEKVRQLLITDDLTGLFTGGHLHALLDYEIERCRRYGMSVSLIFLDIDHFKKVNDSHGHLVGSRVLAEIGALIGRSIRKSDRAARYGGDEFVVLLPCTDKEGAITAALNLCQAIRGYEGCTDTGEIFRVTASFGIASFPADAQDKEDLLRIADQKMYDVKESTRDGIQAA